MVDAVTALALARVGRALQTPRAELLRALDPRHFVDVRSIPGGPAPTVMRPALDAARTDIRAMADWVEATAAALDAYPVRLRKACDELLRA